MDLVTLELQGKFAHFRKYYGNNTALSYALPPRTTITGIIAAILGRERDTYYREMASDRLRIGVGINSPIKKTFHRLNNLKIIGNSDFRGRMGPVQTPYEIITPWNLRKGMVNYRIFISAYEVGQELLNEILSRLETTNSIYNLSLGAAFCHAHACNVIRHTSDQWQTYEANRQEVLLSSAVPIHLINTIMMNDHRMVIEEEMLPGEFTDDKDRELKSIHKVLFSTSGHPLSLKISGLYHSCKIAGRIEYFTFLED